MAKGLKKLVGVTLAVVLVAALAIYVLRPATPPSTSSVVNPPGTDANPDPQCPADARSQGKGHGHEKDKESAKDKAENGKGHGHDPTKERGHGDDPDRHGDKKHEKHASDPCGEPKPDRPDKPEKRPDSDGRRKEK